MTIELIGIGHTDTNDHEEDLTNWGHKHLKGNLKEDVMAVWKFLCNEELILQQRKNGIMRVMLIKNT